MRNIFIVTQNILKVIFKKKGNIFFYLLLPILCAILSIMVNGGNINGNAKVGIVDKDKSYISKETIDAIKKNDRFTVVEVNEEDVKNNISEGKIDVSLVIPSGFEKSILNGNAYKVQIVSIRGEDITTWIKNFTNFYIKNLEDIGRASLGDEKNFKKIYEDVKKEKLSLKEFKVADKNVIKNITQMSIGFLIFFELIGALGTAKLIIKEKKDKTYYRICASPTKIIEYIGGNVLANFLIISIQTAIVIISLTKIFKVDTSVPNSIMFLILVCFGLVSIAIGMLIVVFSNTSAQASAINTILVTPTCMIGGCFWPFSFMPLPMQKLAYFTPQRWAIQAIEKIQQGGSLNTILINLLVLLAFAAAFFMIAAYRFKKNKDLKSFA